MLPQGPADVYRKSLNRWPAPAATTKTLPPISMRLIFTLLILQQCLFSFGQVDKGIYKRQKGPFETCYLTYNDSIIEIEYFYLKGGQVFGHKPAKKLIKTDTEIILKSLDDSIKVFQKGNILVVKTKGHSGRNKLYPCSITSKDIDDLRNRNKYFQTYQDSIN